MNGELKIKIKLEFKDFLNFQFWISRKRFIRPLIFVAFLLVLPSIISSVMTGSFVFLSSTVAIIPISILSVFPIILLLSIYFSSKKTFEHDPIIKKEQEFIFNSSGFTCTTESSTTTLKWEEIYKQIESPKNFLIYCSPSKIFIIPKHFLSDIETADLKVFLFSHVVSKEKKTFLKPGLIIPIIAVAIGIAVGTMKKSDSDNSEDYFNQGYKKIKKGDFAGSIVDFNNAIKQNPSYSNAYSYRGYAKEMLHNYSEAIKDCNRALELDSQNDAAYYYMAYAKCKTGDSIGGCNDYNKSANMGNESAKKDMEYYCN